MDHRSLRGQNGFSTLLVTILFGIIAAGIAVSALIMGLRATRTSLEEERYHRARDLANACGEHALFALRQDFAYDGTTLPALPDGNCAIVVSGTGNTDRRLDIAAATDTNTMRVKIMVNAVLPVTDIASWEEVTGF